ncbi:DUF397 domain-containing protein [Actinomadura syzygii]|uniref:DUF397 domain-containing protein n=1 Tax=Actinomadura syzygii TaxID=1427538 RepID=A0A5D0TPH3_9ACTN|nr:DUF397 domain-containing protein [Actinomadura syzygii]TYC07573.1 DUF397 domain-containing protein [Actinomadura syzygii]
MARIAPQGPETKRVYRSITFPSHWRKARRSMSANDCVEVAHLARARIGIRDSKNTTAPPLTLSAANWRNVIIEIKRGHHDLI